MKKMIKYIQTLFYYDAPIIFHGEDNIGCSYICLLINQDAEALKYICTPVSKRRLANFNKGFLDLKTIYIEPELDEFYLCEIENIKAPEQYLTLYSDNKIPEDWLPEPEFYLTDKIDTEDEVLIKSKELNKTVLYVSLDPPEAQYGTKIVLDRLSHFLSVFQNLIKHAYKKACKVSSPGEDLLDPENAYKLQVIGFADGSFTVQFEPFDTGDIFGSCPIENAFTKFDELTQYIHDPVQSLNVLRKNRGHLANAYLRLLQFIKENNTSIEYRWAAQFFKKSKKRRVPESQAVPLLDFLSQKEDIRSERIKLEGFVIKADQRTNTWKLRNLEDGKEYFGKIKEETNLSVKGFVIGIVKYKFECEEIIEEILGTGKEQKSLFLIEREVLDSPTNS
jgi:hypothetical protein